jgi:ApbE superfamily uncharacterized protein (UPF0280 family)
MLPDGKRLHLHYGPIDLVIGADGAPDEIRIAYAQARARFDDILPVLVTELAMLRRPVAAPRWRPDGPVARRMMEAVWPHRGVFVTPMAAVAGAVADEMLAALTAGRDLRTAYVNNGGDIAFHAADGQTLTLGMVGDLHAPAIDGLARLGGDPRARGIATSGWAGRSHSLGIADAVTVLAPTAAAADVAATLIANAVDADHPAIVRRPAREIDDDCDLGDRLATVDVGVLDDATIATALDAGARRAEAMHGDGLIEAALLMLKGESRAAGRRPPAIAA